MGETITSKGKTVKEALNLALNLLDKKQSEVDIEILSQGEKGFLGLISKQAVVRVTVKENTEELFSKEISEQKNGIVP